MSNNRFFSRYAAMPRPLAGRF